MKHVLPTRMIDVIREDCAGAIFDYLIGSISKSEGSKVRMFFGPKVRMSEIKGPAVRTKIVCSSKVQYSEIRKCVQLY